MYRAVAKAFGVATVGAGAVWIATTWGRDESPEGTNAALVVVGPFEVQGQASWRSRADSLATALVERLGGHPDFRAISGGTTQLTNQIPTLTVRGRVEARNGSPWLVTSLVSASGLTQAGPPVPLADDWRVQADSLRDRVEGELWTGALAKDPYVPRDALPADRVSKILWQTAERLYARGHWSEADASYREAERADSTCLLCSFRIIDIDRWLSRPHDPDRLPKLRRNRLKFPEQYQSLLSAIDAQWPDRRDTLEAITKRFPEFFLGWYWLGDEVFHRGPLFGRSQHLGLPALEKAVQLKPGFAPGWSHIGWIKIGEGDSVGARVALDSLESSGGVRAGIELAERQLLPLGLGWRFGDPTVANRATTALADPTLRSLPVFAAGPRMMPTFATPRGAVEFGRLVERDSRSDLQASGGLAQIFGYLALGRTDSVRSVANRLRGRGASPEMELFLTEVEGAIVLFELDAGASTWKPVEDRLADFLAPGAAPLDLQLRSRWLASLGAIHTGKTARPTNDQFDQPPGYRVLATTIDAITTAGAGNLKKALELTDPIVNATAPDPILRP
jgi:hypothetical protein